MRKESVLPPESQAIIATDIKKNNDTNKKNNESWVQEPKESQIGASRKCCEDSYNQSWSFLLLAFEIKYEIRIRLPGESSSVGLTICIQ
jgi:hypothetical protein